LRRFKVDELPQLFNVFLGDMSIIGPRPCMPELLEQFDSNGQYRTKVFPGMTGLAQVNGNIYLDWKDRWQYDRYYVENISFLLDWTIIMKTIKIILTGEDKYIKKPSIY
jgi:lipopolysaccharide/colanic/teichoic acid biosynthesis glycosyltransferase